MKGEIGFTRFNIAALFLTYIFPTVHANAIPILFCTSLGIIISFHGCQILDGTSWSRLCILEEVSMSVFLIGNIIMHIMPAIGCLWAIIKLELDIHFIHGFIAAFAHFVWGYWVSKNGKFLNLDHIYAPMEHHHWHSLWICAFIAEVILAPYFL